MMWVKRKIFILIVPIVIILFSSVSINSQPQEPAPELKESNSEQGMPISEKDYLISPGDLLQVTVYQEPDLSTSVRVSQNGIVKLALLGDVGVLGLSVREAERKITKLLTEDYLVNPQVSVFVSEYARVYVLGKVGHPGFYELRGELTLTSAVAMAGGFLPESDTSKVKLIRTVDNRRQTQEIDMDEIANNQIQDIRLKPNDTIIVEEYGRITIIGQVRSPGTYSLKKDLTLLEAIGLAGGFTPIASIDSTSVIRVDDGKKRIIRVKVSDITKRGDKTKDIILKGGDTVVVPESFF